MRDYGFKYKLGDLGTPGSCQISFQPEFDVGWCYTRRARQKK